jgi:hypothetical protein
MEAVALDRQELPAGKNKRIGKPGTPLFSGPETRIA